MSKNYELSNGEKEVIEMKRVILCAIKNSQVSKISDNNEETELFSPPKSFYKVFIRNLSEDGFNSFVRDELVKTYSAEDFCCPDLIMLANGELISNLRERNNWLLNNCQTIRDFSNLENASQVEWEMKLAMNDIMAEKEEGGIVFPEIMIGSDCFLQRYQKIKESYLDDLEIVPFAENIFNLLKDLDSVILINGNMVESWIDDKNHNKLLELYFNILRDREVPVIEVVGDEIFEQESSLEKNQKYKRKTLKVFKILSVMLGEKIRSRGESEIVDDCLNSIKSLPEMYNDDKKNLFCVSLLSRMDNYIASERKAVQKTLKKFVKDVLSFEELDKEIITIDYDEDKQVANLLFDIKRWQLGVYMFSLGIFPTEKETEKLNYTKLLGDSLVINDYLEFWRNNRNFLPTQKLVRFLSKAMKEMISDVEIEPGLSGTNSFVDGKYGNIILTFKNINSKDDLILVEKVLKKMLYLPVDSEADYEQMVVPFIDEIMMKNDIKKGVVDMNFSSKRVKKF